MEFKRVSQYKGRMASTKSSGLLLTSNGSVKQIKFATASVTLQEIQKAMKKKVTKPVGKGLIAGEARRG
jgi:hypothetical protein